MSDYYDDIPGAMPEMQDIETVSDTQISGIVNGMETIALNTSVSTASEYLARLETIFGITIDITKSDTFRRENIISKIKGNGTTTVQLIKDVAMSFSNGEVDVIEDNAHSKFTVKFVGIKGIPENMDGLTNSLNEIKPAHLTYEYSYTYNIWNQISAMTWTQASAYTWEGIRTR